jgi:CBS domain-containing protein
MKRETRALERIDSFPYRHSVGEVMSAPIATISPQATLVEASRVMASQGISSMVVADESGQAIGIVTERDVLRATAQSGSIGLHRPLAAVMSCPVAGVREDALVFVAMGRMERLKLRHLLVTDRQGKPVGMITSRTLLKLRAGQALALGDEIHDARDAQELAVALGKIPDLAANLLGEGIAPVSVAMIIGSVLRDMTARASEMAEKSMAEDGWGPPPAQACVLVLGAGGRGESLFAGPQENALLHDGSAEDELWFAEVGRRLCTHLDQAGLYFGDKGTLCMNAPWRLSLTQWASRLSHWAKAGDGEDLQAPGLFADSQAVYGTLSLADQARAALIDEAGRSASLLGRLMPQKRKAPASPVGLFGRFATEAGRIDIDRDWLTPLAALARTLAIRHAIPARQTIDRLTALEQGGHVTQSEARELAALHDFLLGLAIKKQTADIASGHKPSCRIDPARLSPEEKARLKNGHRMIEAFGLAVGAAISKL